MRVKQLDLTTLSGQRWFAGKHRPLERVLAAGSLELPGGALRLAEARYADAGDPDRYLLIDPATDWPAGLRALLAAPISGPAGELRLRLGPGVAADDLQLDGPGRTSVPSLDQSNTLLAIDRSLLVKLYRRPLPGVHPEVEIGEALAGTGAPVARHLGALELRGEDGQTTVLGCLQEFIADAESGWEWPIAPAMSDLRAGAPSPSTLALARMAGLTLARLHLPLARMLGCTEPGAGEVDEYEDAVAALRELAGVEDVSVQALGVVGPRIEALLGSTAPQQRIHGDLHVAQLLHTPGRLTVIDFEGNPTLELSARRVPMSPLRDLATLRRSFDHVATAAARRVREPGERTLAWSAEVLAEISAGYRAGKPDGKVDLVVLHAFEIAAELRELRYARAVLPEWAYVAHAGLDRLAAEPEPAAD